MDWLSFAIGCVVGVVITFGTIAVLAFRAKDWDEYHT